MTVLQVMVTIIWLSAGVVGVYTSIKGGQLYKNLQNKNLVTDTWVTSIAIRKRALRTLIESTENDEVKKQAYRAIVYFRISVRIVWGSFLLILVLMMLSGNN